MQIFRIGRATLLWLAQAGPHAPKHHGWAHPVTVLLWHYTTLIAVAFGAHDWLVNQLEVSRTNGNAEISLEAHTSQQCLSFRQSVALFLACYLLWFLLWRLRFCHPATPRNSVLYEFTWLCNGTLVLGAFSLFANRPTIAVSCCVTVAIDQMLWYVDLAGFLLCGVFPVGVAKYLTWPETSWTTRVTCTHHLWTIPLLLTASGGVVSYSSYFLSLIIMITNVSLSRLMIPNELRVGKKYKYLNVNLSHELWKDINIEFLRINYDNPPCLLYLFRLLSRWQMFNTLCFGILIGLCEIWFAGSNHVCKQ